MRFLHPERDEQLELALDEVFIVPGRFDGRSRAEADLSPVDFAGGSHPLAGSATPVGGVVLPDADRARPQRAAVLDHLFRDGDSLFRLGSLT